MPPFEDAFGRLWTWDGRCLNAVVPGPGELPPEVAWLAEWPEDLRWEALQASVTMELRDSLERDFLEALRRRGWPL